MDCETPLTSRPQEVPATHNGGWSSIRCSSLEAQAREPHSPSDATALSSNTVASSMYPRSTTTERCPVCLAMARSDAPLRAASVTKPRRSEWPENDPGSLPMSAAARFTILATVRSVSAQCHDPPLVGRKIAPSHSPPPVFAAEREFKATRHRCPQVRSPLGSE